MSLARWLEGDVYVFYDSMGGVTCMSCRFMPLAVQHKKGSRFSALNGLEFYMDFNTNSRTEMLAHLKQHREAGDRVPCRAFETLEEDIRLSGDDANVFND